MSTELLTLDGVDLRRPHLGVTTRSGRYSMPSTRGENLILPGRSGSMFVPNKPLEEGEGELSCWTIGATSVLVGADYELAIPATMAGKRKMLEDNLASMQALFTRPHRLSTIRAYAATDTTIRRAVVEFTDMGEPDVHAGGTRAEFSVTYSIPSVFWEDEDGRTQAATADATLPKTLSLTSFANMSGFIEDAVITVTGPITNPRVTDPETGSYIEYTGTVADGTSWVIDSGSFASTISGASVMATTKHVGGYRLLTIPNEYAGTRTPRLVLSGSAGGAATNLSVSARRKWVSG